MDQQRRVESSVSESVCISLALLKAQSDFGKDYIDNFVPLVRECLRLDPADVVSLPEMQQLLQKEFLLRLPASIVETILKRLKSQGALKRESGSYIKVRGRLDDDRFQRCRQDVLRMYHDLVQSFQRDAAERFSVSLDTEQAEVALEAFIGENQLNLLSDTVERLELRHESNPNRRYLVARYVCRIAHERAYEWECFEAVHQGYLLANAVYLPDMSQARRRFTHTDVYCDTGVLLPALGYADPMYAEPCTALLTQLRSMKISPRCFAHTREEVYRALANCAWRLQADRLGDAYGPVMAYFIEQRMTGSDVRLLMEQLDDNLRGIGVQVVDKPSYDQHPYVIDHEGLACALAKAIPDHSEAALAHDVESIAAVMRLRAGLHPRHVEDCRAVFATKNATLVHVSREFLSHELGEGEVSPSITDSALTNILWLKQPTAAPELPRKRVIADCYAATQPSAQLWRQFVTEVEKLRLNNELETDDYYNLRYSLRAREYLMEETHGEAKAFTEATVTQIMSRMDQVRRQELDRARTEIQVQLQYKLDEKDSRISALEDEAARTMARFEGREASRRETIARRAAVAGRICAWIVAVALGAVCVVGTANTFPWSLPKPAEARWRYALSTALALLFVLTVGNALCGVCVRDVFASVRSWCTHQATRAMRAVSGDGFGNE